MSSSRPGSSGARTKLVKEITSLAKDRISPPPSPALLDGDDPDDVSFPFIQFVTFMANQQFYFSVIFILSQVGDWKKC